MSIYDSIEKPIISLAPMEDVTDTVFRQVVASVGKPDLFYTEFVNVEGLNSKGRDGVIHRLKHTDIDTPLIAQLWGTTPSNFLKAAELVSDMGFDGIDINMGCSIKKISERDTGAGLIKSTPSLVKDIIVAVQNGGWGLPVSVKTRLGWDVADVEGWIGFLLNQSLDALTVHMRTARGQGTINANWSYAEDIRRLRDTVSSDTLLFGNGDITSKAMANEYINKYSLDGAMIGRAAISNPWIFSDKEEVTRKEKLELFKRHILLFKDTWMNSKNFHSLKKFFRAYINNFEGSNELRAELMNYESIEELLDRVNLLLET
jgi:tRNA-dihydrouridine synthase